MPIKSREEIEASLIAEMVTEQNEITAFEPKTAIRGFITAVAGTVRELWNDLYRMQRKIFLNTASGTDLDDLGAERGINRAGATSAGVLLTFMGTTNSGVPITIPKGTAFINPDTNVSYTTQADLTIGVKNPDLVVNSDSPVTSETISDNVWALCDSPGEIGNSPVNTITQFRDTPIQHVSNITNLSPARGGTDVETDTIYRERIRNYISILNQGTPAFYEAACKELNPRILRVKTKKDYSHPDTIKLIIVTTDGAPLAKDELDLLARQVQEKHRAFTNVVCENIRFTYITVSERIKLLPGYTVSGIFAKTADVCADYLNYRNWDFGKSISIDNVFSVCDNIEGVDDIELASFQVKSGTVESASITQTLFMNEIPKVSGNNSVAVENDTFSENSLINKFVRLKAGDGTLKETKQIEKNGTKTITIYGNWKENPVIDFDRFDIIDLYRYTSSTDIFIDGDSLPYFDGLEITDLNTHSASIASGIKITNNAS